MDKMEAGIKKLGEMDEALLARVDRIKNAIESGEYSHAKQLCRLMDDDLHQANALANKLADAI